MEIVTTGHEDREAYRLLDKALEEAYGAGLIDKPEAVPEMELLWEQLMKIIGVRV